LPPTQAGLRRVSEAIHGGLSAEAAVHRVAGELRDHMRRIVDPYLRERLADLETWPGRLLVALDGGGEPDPVPEGAILLARRLGPAELLHWHGRGIAGVVVEEGEPGRPRRYPGARAGYPGDRRRARHHRGSRDRRRGDPRRRGGPAQRPAAQVILRPNRT